MLFSVPIAPATGPEPVLTSTRIVARGSWESAGTRVVVRMRSLNTARSYIAVQSFQYPALADRPATGTAVGEMPERLFNGLQAPNFCSHFTKFFLGSPTDS